MSHRIGYVSAFPPGRNSLNEFGFHFVKHLAENIDVDEVLLYADDTDAGPPMAMEGVTPMVSWKFNDLRNVWTIARDVRRTKPDAVLLNLQFATFGDKRIPGGLGLLAPLVLRLMKVPTGVILHNLVDNVDMQDAGFAGSKLVAKAMTLAGQALTHLMLRADYVALTIPRYVELLNDKYNATNALLAPHGSFEEIDEPSFDIPDGPRQILAFGKWGTYKTVDALVDAYRELIGRGYDDIELVIAGTDSPNSKGYLAGVEAGCRDLPGVRFTGYVEEDDVAPMFTNSTVTVFPYTSTTGSSGVLHQAGSYGRAAVLPRIGDFLEVIEEEGFLGEYFEPDNPIEMADAISKLLDDPTRREELGRRNFLASTGIPMAEVIDWHLIHIERLIADRT